MNEKRGRKEGGEKGRKEGKKRERDLRENLVKFR